MKIINKPWGYEKWIGGDGTHYFTKQIFMKAGFKTSLQYHEKKTETLFILLGQGIVTLNDKRMPFKPDVVFHIKPKEVHRIEAVSDITIMETSTIELDDVIRLQDDWNRGNGKIEREHR